MYLCVHVCMFAVLCMYVRMYVCMYVCLFARMCMHVCMHGWMDRCVYMPLCKYLCMPVCIMYACMHAYTLSRGYMHTYHRRHIRICKTAQNAEFTLNMQGTSRWMRSPVRYELQAAGCSRGDVPFLEGLHSSRY